MFEALTTRRRPDRHRQAGSLAIALLTVMSGGSATLVTGGQLVNALDTEPMPLFFDQPLEAAPPLPPPPPLGVQDAPDATETEPDETEPDETEPEEVEALPETPPIPLVATLAAGHPGGHPDGQEGGHPDGHPDGELGGDPRGVVGGTGTAVHWTELSPRSMPKPRFPKAARAMGMDEVRCRVHVRVDERGRVASAGVSDCPKIFHPAIEEATRSWRFRPYRVNGVSQPTQAVYPIVFRLTDAPL